MDAFRTQSPAAPAPRQHAELVELSTREQEVLEKLAKGYFIKEIAEQMAISYTSVRTYTDRIYEKLHV